MKGTEKELCVQARGAWSDLGKGRRERKRERVRTRRTRRVDEEVDHLRLELAASGSAFPFLQAMILSLSQVMISPLLD